tara:strand:- start:57 stop:209 length:153 start_codon:yes stop_codon:yes gene_type:complete
VIKFSSFDAEFKGCQVILKDTKIVKFKKVKLTNFDFITLLFNSLALQDVF